ncbi:MAG: fimbrillin family protein [Bacteroidales bacterium]|nr:fimbrillin family protein [Bacteroidales bacterium]MDD4671223.1 fimbrillin family protein [Bacteroidales bacterium]
MKQILIGLATCAMIFTNCSKVEVVESAQNTDANAIGFSTYSNVATKAPINSNSDLQTDGNKFAVTAYINQSGWDTPYMNNPTLIKYNGTSSKWEYDNAAQLRFWPEVSETLDFYAYYPTTATPTTASKAAGMVWTNYTVPTTEADQIDLLYENRHGITRNNCETSNNLKLTFKHALTQINYGARVANNAMTVVFEKLSIHNVVSNKNFTIYNNSASWSDATTPALENYESVLSAPLTVPYHATDFTSFDKVQLLIPQTFTAWDPATTIAANNSGSKGAYIEMSARISVDIDGKKLYLLGTDSTFGTLYIPISSDTSTTGEWVSGKKLTYNIVFGDYGSTPGGAGYDEDGKHTILPITFETAVTDWTTGTGSIVL